jgi:NADH dehydrogenase FAD-containing subunit
VTVTECNAGNCNSFVAIRNISSDIRVVGAGYTGTEVAANGQLMTTRLARELPGLAGQEIRWMLLDLAPRLLPELDPHLSKTAERVLRRHGSRC